MTSAYTLTVTFAPVTDGDWSKLHLLLDVSDGSFLIENDDVPTAVMVLDSGTATEAVSYAAGMFLSLGLEPRAGLIEPFDPLAVAVESAARSPEERMMAWRDLLALS